MLPLKGRNTSIHDANGVEGVGIAETAAVSTGGGRVYETPMSLNAVDLLVMVSKVHGMCCATTRVEKHEYSQVNEM